MNTNLDTRAAVDTFLVNFDREGVGDGSFYEGTGDVVGVVTPLRGVAQVVLHGVQVVEVGVRLWVH